jgi:hypothetical protein
VGICSSMSGPSAIRICQFLGGGWSNLRARPQKPTDAIQRPPPGRQQAPKTGRGRPGGRKITQTAGVNMGAGGMAGGRGGRGGGGGGG